MLKWNENLHVRFKFIFKVAKLGSFIKSIKTGCSYIYVCIYVYVCMSVPYSLSDCTGKIPKNFSVLLQNVPEKDASSRFFETFF